MIVKTIESVSKYTEPKWPFKRFDYPEHRTVRGMSAFYAQDLVSEETIRSLITPMGRYRLHQWGWKPPNFHDLYGPGPRPALIRGTSTSNLSYVG